MTDEIEKTEELKIQSIVRQAVNEWSCELEYGATLDQRLAFKIGYRRGYKAALAANTWVAIKSADDLPKEAGMYLGWMQPNRHVDIHADIFWWDGKDWPEYLNIAAWARIPSYTPEAK